MKRTIKISVIILALVVLLAALAVTMAACNKDDEQNVASDDGSGHVHDFTLVEAKSPTCTEDGNVQYYTCTCGKCFDSEKREIWKSQTVIPATGHDKVTTSWESDDTSHWHKCNNCDEKLDIQRHSGSVCITDSVATCTAKAHRHLECPGCGYHMTEEDYGKLAPHQMGKWIEDSPASCTKLAHHHKECANCDYREDEDYGNLLPHEMSDWIEDSPASCTAKAHHHKECANCDARVDEDYGELLPHTVDWIEDYPASCTKRAHHHGECEVCGQTMQEDYGDLLPHELGDWVIEGGCNKDNTPVTRHKDCANCDYQEIDENYIVPHTWKEQLTADNQKECTKCGYKEKAYEERDGKIYFGEYPQTKETENGITATLAQMSGNRPSKGNSGDWTDYGYYINGSKSEYMWYIDLEYGGERYRGVYFSSYRPYSTTASSSTGNSYYINTLYWFKWEPIEWRVIKKTDGEAFLMSNVILDSQQYYRTDSGTRNIDGRTVYPNNYKESDIRAWLNGTFYNWAFDEFEQAIINETLVDNSASTTASSPNDYACENTNDKVFLLSYQDVLNTSYGFDSVYYHYDTARQLKTTGYAQSQGAFTGTDSRYKGNGLWWLRSPYSYNSSYALRVDYLGDADYDIYVYYTYHGVVPAIKIQL